MLALGALLLITAADSRAQDAPRNTAPAAVPQRPSVEVLTATAKRVHADCRGLLARLTSAPAATINAITADRVTAALAELQQLRTATDAVTLVRTPTFELHLETIAVLAQAKAIVDARFQELQQLRGSVALASRSAGTLDLPNRFLAVTHQQLETSARLNSHLRGQILSAAYRCAHSNEQRLQLLERLATDKSTIGSTLMLPLLFDPPAAANSRVVAATPVIKQHVLTLLGRFGRSEAVPSLSAALPVLPSEDLRLLAMDAIARLGVQQSIPPTTPLSPTEPVSKSDEATASEANRSEESDDNSSDTETPESEPTPPLSLSQLQEQLAAMDPEKLSPGLRPHREQLIAWLKTRSGPLLTKAGYWGNGVRLMPGDWLLYCNSSPYSRFTNLTPGLFTHVGILTTDERDKSTPRLVVVDLNERQTRLDGENVETNLPLPRHFAVLRHRDVAVREQMAESARQLLGNAVKFDLTFNTKKLRELQGSDLTDHKLETYCVGILIACAQNTGLPWEQFFPLDEAVASSITAANLKRIGLQIGDGFVSPTGAYFSPAMELVHFSQPMYDPGSEVQQSIYDHFAGRLDDRTIQPQMTLYQSMRTRLADLSKARPFLAEAVAKAAGVDPGTDLAAAARASAVVESLDAIAMEEVVRFRRNWGELMAPPPQSPAQSPTESPATSADKNTAAVSTATGEQPQAPPRPRTDPTIAELKQLWYRGQLSPLQLEQRLIETRAEYGRQRIDAIFFGVQQAP